MLNIDNIISIIKKKLLVVSGQSIVEIVVALGIFAIMAGTIASSILGSLTIHKRNSQYLKAGALAREGLEAVRAIRNRDWNELIYSRSAVRVDSGRWKFVGEGTTDEIGEFTRTIDFMPVYRNSSGGLAGEFDPGANLDNNSQAVIATITWDTGKASNSTITYTTYLTNWQ